MKALRSSYEMKRYTLPQLLRLRAEHEGDRVALREKDLGIWNEITYAQYFENVLLFAHGLLSLGFGPGERLAIIADNIPEWLYAELGAQAVRGISVGVYQSSLPPEIAYMLAYTGASVVLAEDQEQVDKLYEIRNEIPHVRHVIYEDEKGMRGYQDPWLLSFAEVLERGREHRRKHPDAVERLLLEASPEEVCHLSSTSGTTGRPKAAMLRHRNLIHMGVALQEVDPLLPTDDYLSFLPLAWIGEQMTSVAMALTGGFAVNFPEAVETALQDLKEVGPHVMFSPPRVWEAIQSQVWVRISESPRFNRLVYERLLRVGYRAAEYRMRGKPLPLALRLAYGLADWVLFRPLRDQLGFLRLRRAYTGGRRPRPRHLPLLPRHRGQPQADLRPDGDRGHRLRPPGRGRAPGDRGQAHPRYRGQDQRGRGGPLPLRCGLRGVLGEARCHGGDLPRGLAPHGGRGLPHRGRAPRGH